MPQALPEGVHSRSPPSHFTQPPMFTPSRTHVFEAYLTLTAQLVVPPPRDPPSAHEYMLLAAFSVLSTLF